MAAKDALDLLGRLQVTVNDPLNRNAGVTKALGYDGKFYISAVGCVQHFGQRAVSSICAKVYTTPQNVGDKSPDDQTLREGYYDKGQRLWFFYGSEKTPEKSDNKTGGLIEVFDPKQAPLQYLYVWATMSDGANPEKGYAEIALVLADDTNSGDRQP